MRREIRNILGKDLEWNGRACIRHQCRKTAILSCHRFLINSGVESNEEHLNMD
jgi:hypothetical protein